MDWTIEYDPAVEKDLRKLDRQTQRDILDYMDFKVAVADNPRQLGKPLGHDKKGIWRYRTGIYRILCRIEDHRLVVLVIEVGKRDKIYR